MSIKENLTQEHPKYIKVHILIYKLQDIILKAVSDAKRISYTVPLGLLVGLVASLFTTGEFRDFSPYMSKSRIEDIFYFAIFSCGVWFITTFVRDVFLRKPQSIDEIIANIIQNSENIYKRMMLFLVISNITYKNKNTTITKILFKYDSSWDMWVLPNYKKLSSATDDIQQVVSKLFVSEFSTSPDKTLIRYCPNLDLEEEKMSPESEKLTLYQFNVFHIQLTGSLDSHILYSDEFILGGIKYKWFTLAEVMQHGRSLLLNKGILLQLKDEFAFIISALPLSCSFTVE